MSAGCEVLVAGTGCSAFGTRAGVSFRDLLCEAVFEAMWDAGIAPGLIDGVYFATSDLGERYRGAGEVSEAIGVSEIPITRMGGGPVGGGAAFRSGVLAVASGQHEFVLVVGVEKQTHRPPLANQRDLHVRAADPVLARGITPAGVAGLFARRHMENGNLTRDHLDAVLVKNRMQGETNPLAALTSRPRPEEIEDAPLLADPLTRLDVAIPVDGAAAVVLSKSALGLKPHGPPVRVAGAGYSVVGGDCLPFGDSNTNFLTRRAPRAACFQAYTQAGVVNAWNQLSVAEVDDFATVYELISYEDLVFCGEGEPGSVIEQGFTGQGGRLPVNLSGGTLSCGTAPAADVLRRVYEVARQLQARAGERQVPAPKRGVVHGAGGAGAEGFVAVLEAAGARANG